MQTVLREAFEWCAALKFSPHKHSNYGHHHSSRRRTSPQTNIHPTTNKPRPSNPPIWAWIRGLAGFVTVTIPITAWNVNYRVQERYLCLNPAILTTGVLGLNNSWSRRESGRRILKKLLRDFTDTFYCFMNFCWD
jgi:hypothetical protein